MWFEALAVKDIRNTPRWGADQTVGAYIFGIVLALEPRLKAIFSNMSLELSYLLTALPYIVPVVVLVLISRNPVMIRRNAPASLGQAFEPRS